MTATRRDIYLRRAAALAAAMALALSMAAVGCGGEDEGDPRPPVTTVPGGTGPTGPTGVGGENPDG